MKAFVAIGNKNDSSISANTRDKAFSVTQNIGAPFFITHFCARYENAIEDALVSMVDTQRNRNILNGNVQLCTVGQRNNSAVAPLWTPLLGDPIRLDSGQSIDVYLTMLGTGLSANQFALLLLGYQNIND